MTTFYTGIGSRKVPPEIALLMTAIGSKMEEAGFVLRSGGAAGADSAFAAMTNNAEIYRPLRVGGKSPVSGTIDGYPKHLWVEAERISAELHPFWGSLDEYAKALHTRNAFQVLGRDLQTPSKFVICWTPDGADGRRIKTSRETGGTGTAIRLAAERGIPVANLHRDLWRHGFTLWCTGDYPEVFAHLQMDWPEFGRL